MKIKLPLLAVASLLSYSLPCYSETAISGTTNNAVVNGYTWSMDNLLPAEAGLVVNGVVFRYSTIKQPDANLIVTIRNEDNETTGYIYEHVDDWSGLPGSTIVGYDPLPNINGERWGDGSIATEGDGQVADPSVQYTYRYDTCYNPLSDPSCPGFEAALYKYLLEMGLLGNEPDINDPYYDEWVQLQLEREASVEEDQTQSEEENEEKLEQQLEGELTLNDLGGNQAEMLVQLNNVPQFDNYYTATITGGVYEDALKLEDTQLPDNRRALRNLANDNAHRTMVRSQYEDIN